MAGKGEINPDAYKKALKEVEKLDKKQKGLQKSTESLKVLWDGISSTIFGISGAAWFEEVPKTTEDIQKQLDALGEMEKQLQAMGAEMNKALGDSISTAIGKNQDLLDKFYNSQKKNSDVIYDGIAQKINITGEDGIKAAEKLYKEISRLTIKNGKDEKTINEEKEKITEKYKISLEDIRDIEKEIHDSKESSEKIWKEVEREMVDLSKITDEELRKKFAIALKEEDIAKFIKEQGHAGLIALKQMGITNKEMDKMAGGYLEAAGNVKEMEKELQKATKSQLSLSRGFETISKNLVQGVIKRIVEFDTSINKAQKDFGINMDDNAAKMTNLVQYTSQFGMSIEDTTQFMGSLSDTLKTTDLDVLANATKDMAAFQLATGISSENLASMTGELMRMGKSTTEIKASMAFANVSAKMFGVNTKKVLESMAGNITKMRTMGFVGGEKSLARMAAQAERLGQKVDEIFNVADKARTIEGAMEMAAQLQLAGGSFANINPMDLLAAGMKGPEEMNKILTSMGKDVGNWVRKMDGSEEYQFTPVDSQRLQIVADATGETMESITNRIRKSAEDNKKLSLIPDSVFSSAIAGMDDMNSEMAKSAISDMLEMGKDGKIEIKADSQLAKMGFKPEDISKLSADQIKGILEKKKLDDENIEKQALENQSLMDSLTALKDAFLNIFTTFQPAIQALTAVIQFLIRNKWILFIGALIAFVAYLPAMIGAMGGLWVGAKSIISSIGGVFTSGIKGMGKSISGAFAQGMTKKVAEKGAGAAIETGGKVAGGASSGGILGSLAIGLKAWKSVNVKEILKFGLFIGIIGGTLGGLALIFKDVDPVLLLAFGAAIVELAGALFIASLAAKGIGMASVLKLSFSMFVIGLAMIPLAAGLAIMEGVGWGTMAKAGVAILGIIGILIGLGAIMMTGVGAALIVLGMVALLGVALTMAAVGAAFIVFAAGMNSLATVDWSGFGKMGAGLMGLIGPLLAFSIAGLLFLNPITMYGMLTMLGVLGLMAMVLAPLGESLDTGASSLNTMATSVQKLNESLGKLDFEKLERLKEISAGFAQASMGGGALTTAMEKLAAAIGGGKDGKGGTGGGRTKTLIVQLKMPDGRTLQQSIIQDIDKVS